MEQEVKVKKKIGGARPGSGRKKGGTNKISAQELIATADRILGKPFIDSLIEGYQDSILNGDRKVRVMYEKLIVDKVISDKQEVEVTNINDEVDSKAQVFADALQDLMKTNKNKKESK
jgi:hypothetical protein